MLTIVANPSTALQQPVSDPQTIFRLVLNFDVKKIAKSLISTFDVH